MIDSIILFVIFVIASLFHGLTGIGITLIATTALAYFYPLPYVLLLTLIPCFIINLLVFLNGGKLLYYLKKYWLLALTSFIGSYLGTKLIFVVAQHYLLIALGSLISLYIILQFIAIFYNKNIQLPHNYFSLVSSGIMAGILGGATNAMSPLLVMYLLSATSHSLNPKQELIKASNLCYMIGKIAQFWVLYPMLIVLPKTQLLQLSFITILSVIFLLIGLYFQNKITQKAFKILILFILFILGLQALYKGFLVI